MDGIDITKRSIGVNFNKEGLAEVVLWAPDAEQAAILLTEENRHINLEKSAYGYWRATTYEISEGTLYKFSLNNGDAYPDPASLSQPQGVHGPSQAVNVQTFDWNDEAWNNLPLEEYIVYELHTGTFSESGDFAGVEEKLDHLKTLGITAIEIMPVAQFPGNRNWGYDGVYPFAVQSSYGGAEMLKQLVNACHQKGIAVVLDVVYNHLGPEGNYFGLYGPYFTNKYNTPWGNAINFDDAHCDAVRTYFIENALMWFRDFHIDALRLDAVHAIKDFSAVHILREIKSYTDQLMQATGKQHYLIVELDLNDTRFINSVDQNGYGMDAQWIDEFHHALRVTAGGDRHGYYEDFTGIQHLAKAYRDAYVYDGQYSPHRNKKFGIRAEHNAGKQFIVFSQNHDQVGNRMMGERTSTLTSFEMQKLMAGAVFISPYLPMLFMGEEWSEPNPFLYFVSHTDPELAEAVRKGRKAEFAAFHAQGEAPDPVSEQTFLNSKLQWKLLDQEPHQTMLKYYQQLIAVRKSQPALRTPDRKGVEVDVDEANETLILYRRSSEQEIICLLNFSKQEQTMQPRIQGEWKKLFDSADLMWRGPKAATDSLAAGNNFNVQPESIIIYTNKIF